MTKRGEPAKGDDTARQFHEAMLSVYRQATEIGYRPTRFLMMVREKGGLAAAKELLRSDTSLTGLAELSLRGRVDISMETLVLDAQWAALFSDDEREIARKRLGRR